MEVALPEMLGGGVAAGLQITDPASDGAVGLGCPEIPSSASQCTPTCGPIVTVPRTTRAENRTLLADRPRCTDGSFATVCWGIQAMTNRRTVRYPGFSGAGSETPNTVAN
jgi:hypothetical protein